MKKLNRGLIGFRPYLVFRGKRKVCGGAPLRVPCWLGRPWLLQEDAPRTWAQGAVGGSLLLPTDAEGWLRVACGLAAGWLQVACGWPVGGLPPEHQNQQTEEWNSCRAAPRGDGVHLATCSPPPPSPCPFLVQRNPRVT